jgi:hypothetical protein
MSKPLAIALWFSCLLAALTSFGVGAQALGTYPPYVRPIAPTSHQDVVLTFIVWDTCQFSYEVLSVDRAGPLITVYVDQQYVGPPPELICFSPPPDGFGVLNLGRLAPGNYSVRVMNRILPGFQQHLSFTVVPAPAPVPLAPTLAVLLFCSLSLTALRHLR